MFPTFVNTATVLLGSLLGFLIRKKIKPELKGVVFTAMGLIAILLGLKMALAFENFLIIIFSLVTGGILGSLWDLDGLILAGGRMLERKLRLKGEGDFSHALLNASLIFCVGAMTIVGSIEAGVKGDYSLLLTKSVMDGFTAIFLTAAMGIGVLFSAVTVLVVQGGLTLLAAQLQPWISDAMLTDLSALGGILIIMIGLNLMELKSIKTANYLPGLVLVLLASALLGAVLP